MTYNELEDLACSNKKICFWGAGIVGRIFSYLVVKTAGVDIDCYFDNKIPPGTEIKDGIFVKDIDYLKANKNDIVVFLTLGRTHQKRAVKKQLRELGIENIVDGGYLFFQNVIKSVLTASDAQIVEKYRPLTDNRLYLARLYKEYTGLTLNLDAPQRFNEKLQWLKINDKHDRYTQLVDKYAVKDYVSKTIGAKHVVRTLGTYRNFDEINFDELPSQFVLKCTHDSGSIVIVDNKDDFDASLARQKLEEALALDYYWLSREYPYKNVERRIIAEEYLGLPQELTDYKLMCFNGKTKCLFTVTDRFTGEGIKVTFFDTDWQQLPFERYYPASKKPIPKPKQLDEMIDCAEKLSRGIKFVRVDFYEIQDRILFGEMTFFPGGGVEPFSSDEWDLRLGDWIDLGN